MTSTNVSAPSRAVKLIVDVERKLRSDGLPPPSVRSRTTSYVSTCNRSARARASSRVRFGTATADVTPVADRALRGIRRWGRGCAHRVHGGHHAESRTSGVSGQPDRLTL